MAGKAPVSSSTSVCSASSPVENGPVTISIDAVGAEDVTEERK